MASHLVTGGARSGKSAYAERLALETALPTVYIATALAGDEEMRSRIEQHRLRRPKDWQTVECATAALAAAIREVSRADTCTIVDCLTLWLANVLARANDAEGPARDDLRSLDLEREALIGAVRAAPGLLILVTNEIGSGVIPISRLSRTFVDEHGITNRRFAEACDRATLMVCGLPLTLKPAASHRAS